MAHLLGAEALHLEYPTRVIFDRVTIGLDEGDRIGIVGRNGDGKSTLTSTPRMPRCCAHATPATATVPAATGLPMRGTSMRDAVFTGPSADQPRGVQ